MTDSEYLRFLDECKAAYRALAEFFLGTPAMPVDADLRAKRIELWREMFAQIDFADAQDALRAMLIGKIDAPQYDWGVFPSLIWQHAKRLREERLKERRRREEASRPQVERFEWRSDRSMVGALLYVQRRMREGADAHEALLEIWPRGQQYPSLPEEEATEAARRVERFLRGEARKFVPV